MILSLLLLLLSLCVVVRGKTTTTTIAGIDFEQSVIDRFTPSRKFGPSISVPSLNAFIRVIEDVSSGYGDPNIGFLSINQTIEDRDQEDMTSCLKP